MRVTKPLARDRASRPAFEGKKKKCDNDLASITQVTSSHVAENKDIFQKKLLHFFQILMGYGAGGGPNYPGAGAGLGIAAAIASAVRAHAKRQWNKKQAKRIARDLGRSRPMWPKFKKPQKPKKPKRRKKPLQPKKRPKKKTKTQDKKIPGGPMVKRRMSSRVLRKRGRRSSIRSLSKQLAFADAPKARFFHSARNSYDGTVNDATYITLFADANSLLHGTNDMYEEIFQYVNDLGATNFRDKSVRLYVDYVTHTYRCLNPGNQDIKVVAYWCTPRRDGETDLPDTCIATSIAETAHENPTPVNSGDAAVTATTDVEMYPSDFEAFRRKYKVTKSRSYVIPADNHITLSIKSKRVSVRGYDMPSGEEYRSGFSKFLMLRIQGVLTSANVTATDYVGYSKPSLDCICTVRGSARVLDNKLSNRIGKIALGGSSMNLTASGADTDGLLFTATNAQARVVNEAAS